MKIGNNSNLVLGPFDESMPCLMIVLMNCQTKLRINHLTAVKSVAILEKNVVKENSIEKEEKSQTEKYDPGSIIWTKYGKYPWWPSMVDMDPDSGAYNKMAENNIKMYHVSFLDAQPTHAWVSETLIRPFSPLPAELKKIKKFDFLTTNAMARAQEAEKLPNVERLRKFSFAMNTPRHRSISTNSGALAASTWSTKKKRDSFTYSVVWQHRVSGVEGHISLPLITRIARCTVFCFRILTFIFDNVDETSPEFFFTAEFKLKVVEKAEKDGNSEAGLYFEVDEKAVRNWRKQKDVLKSTKRKRSNWHGKVKWPALEENLLRWVLDQRNAGSSISTVKIRLRAKSMAEEMQITDFKGGINWVYRFMRRKNLRVRSRTTMCQAVPDDVDEKKASFLSLQGKITEEANSVCWFSTTYSPVGQEKTHFTVMLACCADGTKLKPLLIFKRKTIPKENFPRSVVIWCNEKGWCNEDIMLDWFQEVWKKREGGLTKILQPLDISVNKNFKSHVRACWENWMSEGLHTCTKGGNMRRASCTEVAECVDKSLKSVKVSTIRSGFIKAGIVSESLEITDSEDSDAENELSDTLFPKIY
ncbi:pogo transposable element with KRAB domain [Trichonephila clavipes]|nr:pogo transposable element with KRAB domain [Trichonephila clavipes]